MDELLISIKKADDICRQANVYFEKITQGEAEISNLEDSKKKTKILWIVLAIYLSIVTSGLFRGILFDFIPIVAVCIVCRSLYNNKIDEKNKKIEEIKKQNEVENQKAQEIFDKNYDDLEFLPSDYWYPMATEYLVKTIASKRVNTLGEALDLFDTQLHRWKIEQINSDMLEQQQMQTKHLKGIRKSSAINAAANVTNTAFNIIRRL